MSDASNHYDVVVVGAGVSGCYAAYRLLNGDLDPGSPLGKIKEANGGRLKVGLFEYAGRVGGRLLSGELPQDGDSQNPAPIGQGIEAPRKFAEFGGFRFQPSMHIVADLADHLGLDHESFPVDEPPDNPVYVRGVRLTRAQVNAGEDLPYDLEPWELEIVQGKWAAEGNPDLSTYVLNQAFADSLPNGPGYVDQAAGFPNGLPNGYDTIRTAYQDAFAKQDWAEADARREAFETAKQKTSVDGRSISYWSWWALMTRFISREAIALLEDTGGYNSLWSSGNVPANIQDDFYFLGDPPDHDPSRPCDHTAWRHITTGYSDIPNQLLAGFLANGGTHFLNHQLLRFDKRPAGGGYELVFYNRQAGSSTTVGQAEADCAATPSGCVTVTAGQLVLAMPKLALGLLDQSNFFFRDQSVLDLLDTVLDVPAVRIFMAYPKPWWTAYGATCGRSTTDLNVRQFYYWFTAPEDADCQDSFLLASYSNADAEAYWKSLQGGPDGSSFDDYNGVVKGDGRDDAPQGAGPRHATKAMAALAHQQITETVGATDAPEPYYAHFENWTKVTWGAGWHVWAAGPTFNNELVPALLQPMAGEQIYICGEGYSNVQGWVQGALNTAEVMLQKKLGLTWPDWLSKGGTWLGPGSEGLGEDG